jgi:hypothetical protein
MWLGVNFWRNFALVCRIKRCEFKVYGSFKDLPPPTPADPIAERSCNSGLAPGVFGGALEKVRETVRRYGALDVHRFHKDCFKDTGPHHEGPIAMAVWDADFYATLHVCLLNLWPTIVDRGYGFLDEFGMGTPRLQAGENTACCRKGDCSILQF